MIRLSPSIFVTDEATFHTQTTFVAAANLVAQIDLADGDFVPAKTWPQTHPQKAQTHLTHSVELHFMVRDPKIALAQWRDVPQVVRVLIHHESTDALDTLRSVPREIERWLVLNPETSPDIIERYLDTIDGVMLMGVRPGAQGQPFLEKTIPRVEAIRLQFPTLPIAIDGGVNFSTAPSLATAGVDALCPGSAIFHAKNPTQALQEFQTLLQNIDTTREAR